MRSTALASIRARFEAFETLARQVDDDWIGAELPVNNDKSMRTHWWCVIGARESYTRALAAGQWSGFACSLERVDQAEVVEKLSESAVAFDATVNVIAHWSEAQDELLIQLLEHEVMHEGQIIRHIVGLGRELPAPLTWG